MQSRSAGAIANAAPDQTRNAAPPPDPPKPAPPRRPGEGLNITDLKDMSIQKLTQIAKDLTVGGVGGPRRGELRPGAPLMLHGAKGNGARPEVLAAAGRGGVGR